MVVQRSSGHGPSNWRIIGNVIGSASSGTGQDYGILLNGSLDYANFIIANNDLHGNTTAAIYGLPPTSTLRSDQIVANNIGYQ
jgi:hypothetical protein